MSEKLTAFTLTPEEDTRRQKCRNSEGHNKLPRPSKSVSYEDTTVGAWSWPLTATQCRSYKRTEMYLHSSTCFHVMRRADFAVFYNKPEFTPQWTTANSCSRARVLYAVAPESSDPDMSLHDELSVCSAQCAPSFHLRIYRMQYH